MWVKAWTREGSVFQGPCSNPFPSIYNLKMTNFKLVVKIGNIDGSFSMRIGGPVSKVWDYWVNVSTAMGSNPFWIETLFQILMFFQMNNTVRRNCTIHRVAVAERLSAVIHKCMACVVFEPLHFRFWGLAWILYLRRIMPIVAVAKWFANLCRETSNCNNTGFYSNFNSIMIKHLKI